MEKMKKLFTYLIVFTGIIGFTGKQYLYAQKQNAASANCMKVGTNFWFLAPSWSGENPWKWSEAENGSADPTSYVPDKPYTNGVNPWSQEFLDEIDHYASLRFMDWGLANNWQGSSWSDRRLPDDPDNFGPQTIAGKKDRPGLAYEWMVDLCNRTQSDMWICMPFAADDNFFRQCARLVRDKLDPNLNIYLELGNEFWNFQTAQNHAKSQGAALGLEDPDNPNDDFRTGMRWQAYRSAQMWAIWEEEFSDDKARLINVLAGWVTNSFVTEKMHLDPLFNEAGFNPTGVKPEAYAIAPYFGGNGLDGDASNVFELLRTDIFEHRWNQPSTPSRLQKVKNQYAVVNGKFGLDMVAYEGGQHIHHNALDPNRDPEMYNIYIEYFDAMAPYFTMFSHYTNVGTFGDGGCWGAKEYTGQPMSQAHKYRAIYDWMNNNSCDGSNCTLSASKSSHTFSKDAGSTTVTVTTTESFTVSDGQDWITVSKSGNTVTITVTGNTGSDSRTGTVTISGCSNRTVTITQEGQPPVVNPQPGSCTGGEASFIQSAGEVVIEAENFDGSDQRNDDVQWQTGSTESGFSGSGYVYVEEGAVNNDVGTATGNSELNYNIEFTEAGTYTVWVRRWAPDGAGNSVYAALGGVQSTENDNTGDNNVWVWKSLGTVASSGPGVYTLELIRREDGYLVDKIVINSGETPSGEGPGETTCVSTSVGENSRGNAVSIYPNPVDGEVLNIELKGENITEVAVYDVMGKLVLEQSTTKENLQLNLKGFNKGNYLLRIKSEDNIVHSKFIVSKIK